MTPASFTRLLGVDYVLVQDADRLRNPLRTPASTPDEAIKALAIPGREMDPGTVVLVRPDLTLPQNSGPLSPCRLHTVRPEEVQLECDSATGG